MIGEREGGNILRGDSGGIEKESLFVVGGVVVVQFALEVGEGVPYDFFFQTAS